MIEIKLTPEEIEDEARLIKAWQRTNEKNKITIDKTSLVIMCAMCITLFLQFFYNIFNV